MNNIEQDQRAALQKKLRQLTKRPDWLSDPETKIAVYEIRSNLFPQAFKPNVAFEMLKEYEKNKQINK